MRFFLNACGVVCPLGNHGHDVVRGLDAARPAFIRQEGLMAGRQVEVGLVPGLADGPQSRNNRLMQAALDQIAPAIENAACRYGRDRIAVVVGTSTSGISDGEHALAHRRHTGIWPDSFDYSYQETGSLGAYTASTFALTGPAYTIATACSSSAKVFASARRLIRCGLADAVIVGGADSLCKMTLNGFGSLEALSKDRCNPFSRNRDGITIGEGAAAFLLSAEPGAVELLGVGESSDAHHVTAPHPEGEGAYRSMELALADAGLHATDIAYVNLHGTGTALNDAMESRAMNRLFPAGVACSSTKGMTGHMLGATGGVEAAFLWLSLNPQTSSGLLPPHLWDGDADPDLPRLALTSPGTTIPQRDKLAMLSNSFGFGGSNVSIILGRAG